MPEAIAYGTGVRREEEIWGAPQGAVGGERLDGGYVESGASERAGFQRVDEGGFVEEGAAAYVDEAGTGLHAGDLWCANEVTRFGGFGGGDYDIVRVRQGFFELLGGEDFFGVRGVAFAGARYAPDAHVKGGGAFG